MMKYMGRKSTILLTLILLALLHFVRAEASSTGIPENDFTEVDRYITNQMQAARIPGVALALVQGDQIIYLKGYGTADSSGRAVTPQTPFLLASTTKSITALAVMQLVEAGQIDLDTLVQHYLPWFQVADPEASAQITIRQLLTHTSGLPETAGNEFPVSLDLSDRALEERVRRLATVRLVSPVGARFIYSSANYDILGTIVQTVSGQSFESYLQDHIFSPLEMHHTFTSVSEAEQHDLSVGYRSWAGFPVAFTTPHTRAYVPSGWTVSSSAEDLAHLVVSILNDGRYQNTSTLAISPETLALMLQPALRSYSDTTFTSLGWSRSTMNGVPVIRAEGDAMNYKSRLLIAPEQHLGIVVLINMNSVNVNSGLFEIQRGVLSLLLGQQTTEVQRPHFIPTYPGMIVILVLSVLIGIGIVWSLFRQPQQSTDRLDVRMRGWRVLKSLTPHLTLAIVWPLLLLIGLPNATGRSLPFLILYIPDLGYLLIISAALPLIWLLVRIRYLYKVWMS
jgi:CubicO group peptidase (beta-lactamase class C family)